MHRSDHPVAGLLEGDYCQAQSLGTGTLYEKVSDTGGTVVWSELPAPPEPGGKFSTHADMVGYILTPSPEVGVSVLVCPY
jgi:hypothetical protein